GRRGRGARGLRPAGRTLQAGAVVRRELPPVGSLSERVQLQQRMETPLPEGGHAVDYVPLGSTWARVRARSGRFGREGDGRAAVASHGVMLRFRKDISAGDRVIYRGRPL